MRVQELDPKKRYFIIIENEYVAQEDIMALSQKLKEEGINGVVLAGASVKGGETYYGLYCEQCGYWWHKKDGEPFYYPAPEIASAQLHDRGYYGFEKHDYKVREFGKEEFISRENLKRDVEICPALRQRLANEQARKSAGAW